MIPLILTRQAIVIRGPAPQSVVNLPYLYVYACIMCHIDVYACISACMCLYNPIATYICMYVPEVVPRQRQERRRAVRRVGRQEVATGYLRHHRELATGHHLHHPCPPGCLIPTHTLVSGPADPIVRPSPRPAGPGRTSCS